MIADGETHSVFNQVPELEHYDPLARDRCLRASLELARCDWAKQDLQDYSRRCGGDLQRAGQLANSMPPVLRSHDRRGVRINQVDFHPAYHQLMQAAITSGWPTLPWQSTEHGGHSVRAAMQYLHHQADSGSGCPLTMTFAAQPVLRQQPALAAAWLPRLLGRSYDPDNKPWFEKSTVTVGMGMTEKQGGTDLRSNTTRAQFSGATELGCGYEISGHKWFMSAPMSDAFLILANTDNGLSCFLMPRWRNDGTINSLHFQRLKNKLGNQSNASGEVEFRQAFAWLVGEEGRGIATILQMVALTRFDCMVGSAALMRQALVQALHHSRHRSVRGKLLSEQPLMQSVLTDLAVLSEAALQLAMRTARALDSAADAAENGFLRLATAVGKYWNCKLAPAFIYEAMECLGGNGYVEDGILPRLYREAPVNAIWEGSGNVQCLDVLRAVQREPDSLDAVLRELELGLGLSKHFDAFVTSLRRRMPDLLSEPALARHLTEQLALSLQASLLLRHGLPASAEYFCTNYLGQQRATLFGGHFHQGESEQILRHAWSES